MYLKSKSVWSQSAQDTITNKTCTEDGSNNGCNSSNKTCNMKCITAVCWMEYRSGNIYDPTATTRVQWYNCHTGELSIPISHYKSKQANKTPQNINLKLIKQRVKISVAITKDKAKKKTNLDCCRRVCFLGEHPSVPGQAVILSRHKEHGQWHPALFISQRILHCYCC